MKTVHEQAGVPGPYIAHVRTDTHISQHMRKGYVSHRRPAKASLCISAVSPEPLLFADM